MEASTIRHSAVEMGGRESQPAHYIANSLAYGQACLRPGMTVLNLGCEGGTISADIAERVAPGLIIASDIHPGVLEQARDFRHSARSTRPP